MMNIFFKKKIHHQITSYSLQFKKYIIIIVIHSDQYLHSQNDDKDDDNDE